MGEQTKIEWADDTYSLWHGCARVSEGCRFCYAATAAPRNPGVLGVWGAAGTRVLAADHWWPKLFAWDSEAAAARAQYDRLIADPGYESSEAYRGGFRWPGPHRPRVFPSICDPFEDWSGQVTDHKGNPLRYHRHSLGITAARGIDDLYSPLGLSFLRDYWHALIALTPNLDHLLLTKRPEVAARYYADPGLYDRVLRHADAIRLRGAVPHDIGVSDPATPNGSRNRWIVASVEDQATANERIPPLLRVPAAIHGLSMEPLLGPVDLTRLNNGGGETYNALTAEVTTHRGDTFRTSDTRQLDWIIVGGESGPHARPMHPMWARSIRDQCQAAEVGYFFKQWGEWAPLAEPFRYTPAIGSGNREYVASLRRYERDHGASIVIDDRPEGWDAAMIRDGCAILNGEMAVGRIGKNAAGRMLDGRTWDEFPEVPAHA